jgi:creatinine deaminase
VTTEVAAAAMLTMALEEARQGRAEGGILIGAALFGPDGELLGRGHSRMIMVNNPQLLSRFGDFP